MTKATTRRGGSASSLPFEFAASLPISTCVAQLKKMTITESPSNIAFFRIDADDQRFYLTTRAFRSHLIEAQGLLKRVDEGHTQVSGEVFGTVRSTLLTALLTSIVVILVVALTYSLWALIVELFLVIAAVWYWIRLAQQVEVDQAELVRLFGAALTATSVATDAA